MTEFCKMPEQMGLEILSRLPPKSLMRFKCVRKLWYALINSPSFVAKHLSNSMHNNVYTPLLLKRLVVKDTNTDEKEVVFSLLNICIYNKDDGEYDIDYVVEDMSKGQFIGLNVLGSAWIVGHCDGIICLADLSNVIMLLNPAIMEFKLITCEPYIPDKTINLGFGYDPKSKTYKVINISRLDEETYGDGSTILYSPKIKVYTSCTDSWREIMTESLETETTNICLHNFLIYFKGFCYWSGREHLKEFISRDDLDEENLRQVIISFDMGDEVFHSIKFPDSLYDSYFCWYDMHLLVWNECIALLCLDGDINHAESLGLWVMTDFDGVEGSWIKKFSIGHALDIVPLQFGKSGNVLMVYEEGRIVSYNLDTEELKDIGIHSIDLDNFQVVAYVTTIVGIIGSSMLET